MQKQTMLTWIIPVYNGEKYLAQAINSILRQPCGDFQIIVVDDGSTDRSLEIAKSYTDSRITVLHKKNGGVSSARNMGIDYAESRYIAFLDADDVICKGAYDEKVHDILHSDKYDLLSFSLFYGDQKLKRGNHRKEKNGEYTDDPTQLDAFKHCSSFVYHRRLFAGKSALRFPVGIRIREDVSFQFLANHYSRNILGVDRDWFAYRNNISSVMHKQQNADFLMNNAVPAWKWCKDQCADKDARNHCDARLFAEISEYIRLSCMAGVSVSEIQDKIHTAVLNEVLDNYENLWNGSKQMYESFSACPIKFWMKYRVEGLLVAVVRFVVQMPWIRNLYFRIKYKESIEQFI